MSEQPDLHSPTPERHQADVVDVDRHQVFWVPARKVELESLKRLLWGLWYFCSYEDTFIKKLEQAHVRIILLSACSGDANVMTGSVS